MPTRRREPIHRVVSESRVLMEHEEVPADGRAWCEGISSMQAELADLLYHRPLLRVSEAAEVMETTAQGVSKIANTLRRKGVIVPRKDEYGRRMKPLQ